MTTPVFLTFNDVHDNARANRVRKVLLASGQYSVSGFWPYTAWSQPPHNKGREQIAAQIDQELTPAAIVLVLIGADTAANEWVRYVIHAAHAAGKPMFGIYVNGIADERGQTTDADLVNPFERFAVLEAGRKVRLSERYRTYTWNDGDDAGMLPAFAAWVAAAMPMQGYADEATVRLTEATANPVVA
ncbi:MAG: hypothetical protein HKO62_06855 [Gammaproteobacteria bacterium]|nr:hypothetical protein [Gammaproteobacteria bacterium]